MRRRCCFGGSLLLVLLLASAQASAKSFSRLIAFGDSYSDTGNLGRGTNGKIWLEYLSEGLGLSGRFEPAHLEQKRLARIVARRSVRPPGSRGINFSASMARAIGSRPIDLAQQIELYRAIFPTSDSDALYVIWIGFNDVSQQADRSNEVARSVARALESLYASGARHFLVPKIWSAGTLPSVTEKSEALAERATRLTQRCNAKVDAALEGFAGQVYRPNLFELSRQIFAAPGRFGFASARATCQGQEQCGALAYWDTTHPTTEVHRIIAEHALGALRNAGKAPTSDPGQSSE